MYNKFILVRSRKGLFFILTVISIIISLLLKTRSFAEGSEPTVTRTPIYHCHTGSRNGGGGCYSIARTGTRSYEVPCGGTLHYWGDDWGTSECTRCGASYYGDRGGESCPHSETRTESYTYYEIGCGHSTSEILGYVTYTLDTTEWAKEVHVTIDIENEGMTLSDTPYVLDGNASEDNEFVIDANGTYTFSVDADPNSDTATAAYVVTVSNVDHYEPEVVSYTLSPTDWVKEGVTLSLDEVVDLQPDGSSGCGLHEQPYSYDNGATWTDDPTFFYENNGDYDVLIRDALENTAVLSFTIDNIDNEPPRILKADYDHTKNIREVTIEVECDDVLSDGRDGVGLDDLPYSYDGGKTWTESTQYTIDHNQCVEFRARDKLGNIAVYDINVTNIDDYYPTVTHSLYPGYWTNSDVEVSFEVKDVNPDGSDGIGLPDKCFSYDSGASWTDTDSITVSENCFVQVAVRDKNNNINYYSLDVINIDRIPPTVSSSFALVDNGNYAILTASGQDSESGIDLGSYVWSGPESGSGESIAVTTNGSYTVTAFDRAGNSATAFVEVSGIRFRILPISADIHPLSPDDGRDIMTGERSLEVSVKYPKIASKSPDAKLKTVDESKSIWDKLSEWWNNLPTWLKAAIAAALTLACAGFILLLILWYRSVAVYNSTGEKISSEGTEERYTFKGYKHIHTDSGSLALTIPESLWDKCSTTAFRFKFNPLFAALHKNENIYFSFPEDVVKSKQVARSIDILI